MYAIVDIESTGGKYNEEGITEIAIYRYNGHEVEDQFISLINPERSIQPFVVNLTGINNEMLRSAPKFYEVAKRIVEITKDCVIVAHNAKFDYRILKLEFRRLGFEFERESICTVELSKKLIPNQPSYSLGKLARNLGIPIAGRHRASGDAMATVKLFKILLNKDGKKEIIKQSIRQKPKNQVDTKLLRMLDELPSTVGVYYLHDKEGEVIYIGKSKNIRKRVNQHFTNTSAKSRKIQLEVENVSFENTGNELLALLKENEEIKNNKPKYNRALKRNIFTHALYKKTTDEGYIELCLAKARKTQKSVTTFTNLQQGKSWLSRISEEYELCQKLTGQHKTSGSCFHYSIKECLGACVGEESPEDYNQRVRQVIDRYSFKNKNLLLIDRGRDIDEKSVVVIENGVFQGIGYFNLNFQMKHMETIKNLITPMRDTRDSQHIIQSYLRKSKSTKVMNF